MALTFRFTCPYERYRAVKQAYVILVSQVQGTWDFELVARRKANVAHRRPDIVAIRKDTSSVIIMDITIRTEATG